MTREEIENMPAGEELDALVAEHPQVEIVAHAGGVTIRAGFYQERLAFAETAPLAICHAALKAVSK